MPSSNQPDPSHAEKYVDLALEEACGSSTPPDVTARIVTAGNVAQRAARDRAREAGSASSGRRRSPWLAAALVFLGLGVVLTLLYERDFGLNPDPEPVPLQDPVAGPDYVAPKNSEELVAMLDRVASISVRGCGFWVAISNVQGGDYDPERYAPPRGATKVTNNQTMLHIDLDQGESFVAIESPRERAVILAGIRRAAGNQKIPRSDAYRPGCRIVLHLDDGRKVHCTTELGRSLRVLEGHDLEASDLELANLLAGKTAVSLGPSQRDLGIAHGDFEARTLGGAYALPHQQSQVRLINGRPEALTQQIGRFDSLRVLDISASAWTLDPAELQIDKFEELSLDALGRLQSFAARSLRLDDAGLAALVARMPALERLDLSATAVGPKTLRAMIELEELTAIDLRDCKRLEPPELMQLLTLPRQPEVQVTAGAIGDKAEQALGMAFGDRFKVEAVPGQDPSPEDSAPPSRSAMARNPSMLDGLDENLTELMVFDMTAEAMPKLERFGELRQLQLVAKGASCGTEEGKVLGKLTKLESIGMMAFEIRPGFFRELAPLPVLRGLSFTCDFQPDVWPELAELSSLVVLSFKEPQLDATAMRQLVQAAPQLTTVSIRSDVVMDGEALEPLKDLPNLRVLDLSRTHQLDTAALTRIIENKPLEVLSVSGCDELTAEMLAPIQRLGKQLRRLEIDGMPLTTEGVHELLSALPGLEVLSIGGTSFKPLAFDPGLPEILARYKNLRSLSLISGTGLTIEDLAPLADLSLEELSLHGMALDEDAIREMFGDKVPSLRLPNGRVVTRR
ncbi:MAG: hypothetical protein VYE77_06390 [Planctomycetota bacterium]|nr:hypothetical protein [Planctomycetota bacterium]